MLTLFIISIIVIISLLVFCMVCCVISSDFDDEMEAYEKSREYEEGDD